MTEKLKQIIKRETEKLPKETQEAINTVNWVNVTEQIGKKSSLNESEINDFQVQTLLVLIGLRDADSYVSNIENEVGTSKNEAEKMANEAFEEIFEPITDILEENLKENLGIKKPKFEQDLNFILSGGDYSTFMEQSYDNTEIENEQSDKISGYTQSTPPKMMDMKNKFLYDNDKNQ